jgi:hypothetical protein
MYKPAHFLGIEEAMYAPVAAAAAPAARRLRRDLHAAIEGGNLHLTDELMASANLGAARRAVEAKLPFLARAAMVFGAAQVTGSPRDTRFVGDGVRTDIIDTVVDLHARIVTDAARRFLIRQTSQVVADNEAAARALPQDLQKGDLIQVKKAALPDLADRLNAAVDGSTKLMASVAANVTTSRLVTYGFLVEASGRGIRKYQLQAVLDDRTSEICRRLHGREFSVETALPKVTQTLMTVDPDALKAVAPWLKSDSQTLKELEELSDDDLASMGVMVPPFHPYCRTILVLVGDAVEMDEPTFTPVEMPGDAQYEDVPSPYGKLPDGTPIEFGDWDGKRRINPDTGLYDWPNITPTGQYVKDVVDKLPVVQEGSGAGLPENPLPRVPLEPLTPAQQQVLDSGTWQIVEVSPDQLVSGQAWIRPEDLIRMTATDPATLTDVERWPTAVRLPDGTYRIVDGNHRAALAEILDQPIQVRLLGVSDEVAEVVPEFAPRLEFGTDQVYTGDFMKEIGFDYKQEFTVALQQQMREAHAGMVEFVDENSVKALKDYVGLEYGPMNVWMRTGKLTRNRTLDKVTALRDGVMEEMSPLKRDMTVYRGVPELMKLGVGDVVDMKGFLSTSVNPKEAFRYAEAAPVANKPKGTVFRILLPSGQDAVVTYAEELEVILPPGMKFRVVAVEDRPQLRFESGTALDPTALRTFYMFAQKIYTLEVVP